MLLQHWSTSLSRCNSQKNVMLIDFSVIRDPKMHRLQRMTHLATKPTAAVKSQLLTGS